MYDNLGGCHGSTGLTSIDISNNKYYGFNFPIITVEDWVKSQRVLMSNLGIKKWKFIIGGSLGGMQAFQWALDYPECVDNSIIIAAAPKLTAQNIAFNEAKKTSNNERPGLVWWRLPITK